MRALQPADVLALWERGARRHALDRSALLCAWARPDLPVEHIVDLPLGDVTASLLRLRETSFGARIRGHVDCEHCGARLEVALSSTEFMQPTGADRRQIELVGLVMRAPSLRDLAAIAQERDADRAARQLLARCTLNAGDTSALSAQDMRAAEDALEAIDPNADIALAVHCEACGEHGTAQLDAGALLWDDIDVRARSLLGEVHALASAYGWSEGEILGLSTSRRATYLAMVTA